MVFEIVRKEAASVLLSELLEPSWTWHCRRSTYKALYIAIGSIGQTVLLPELQVASLVPSRRESFRQLANTDYRVSRVPMLVPEPLEPFPASYQQESA